MSNNDNFIVEKDLDILEEIKQIRLNIIREKIKEGIPVKTSDIRIINELASGIENNIFGIANVKLKKKETDVNEANAAMVIELLKTLSTKEGKEYINNMVKRNTSIRPDVLPSEYENITVVEGELDINPPPLDKSMFLKNNEV